MTDVTQTASFRAVATNCWGPEASAVSEVAVATVAQAETVDPHGETGMIASLPAALAVTGTPSSLRWTVAAAAALLIGGALTLAGRRRA